jgi:lipopolysaccharide transport system ATP-binding protein
MTETAVRIEDLGKCYRIQHGGRGYKTIRDRLSQPFKSLLHREERIAKGKEDFWALRNISLEIEKGDRLGIIGRNGAGKSTLLKILSRITEPTTGRVEIRGRIASLLEVGTGFHPELSGRENILLNGIILGMKRREIMRKFDEIVTFAGVERFLDTPVKRYSSGMYVRLAFAVAAHLESDIMIIDEVLAVGDAEFQKKCIGKMEAVSKSEGRTILFVSHNMGAIAQLCNRAVVLREGSVAFNGATDEAISLYLNISSSEVSFFKKDRNTLTRKNQFVTVYNTDDDNQLRNEFRHDEEIRVALELYLPEWNDMLELSLSPCDKFGRRICTIDIPLKDHYAGRPFVSLVVSIPGMYLVPGEFSWLVFIHHPLIHLYELKDNICKFSVMETGSIFSRYVGYDYGCVYPPRFTISHGRGESLVSGEGKNGY